MLKSENYSDPKLSGCEFASSVLKGLKLGQRARLKKIKEKYKDQNEEDRQVRIELLGSAGNESEKKQQQKQNVQKKDNKIQYRPRSASVAIAITDEDEEEKAKRLSQDPRLLSTLTGQPTTDDPLTNVVGVHAPWITLNNYKYNVKVLPDSFDVQAAS
ncbi:unnamed protein product [Rotaria sordida]|uniref:NFACT protein C-terminal domain-containing protein n=2 Tax=Rotaria sordida TaxID=392033 RepID=A0A815IPZ0_9BILA|nr:unnamed protein product [Rotaria sordida]